MWFYPLVEALVHICGLFERYSEIFLASGHM